MDLDLDGIIRCIKQGDENGVHTQLQQFNKEVTHVHTADTFLKARRCC